jgi:predicted nucleic-acid-binding Zn-ribbon protein
MMHGFTKRKCPKCGGNIYTEMDYYLEGGFISWYEQETCLQCGHIIYDMADSLDAIEVASTVDRAMSSAKEPSLV